MCQYAYDDVKCMQTVSLRKTRDKVVVYASASETPDVRHCLLSFN